MTVFRISLAFVFLLMPLSAAHAKDIPQRNTYDFMINNSPLKATELREAFDGQTHDGFYRFEREALPTHKFKETTSSDGRVKHVQGEEV